ncbi:hypothetical protein [Rhodophyticola sp.]|uniref:hypothetical protein n=1 Tax=Rhodophyticola sp. TaxID=2680032 RepID=UPI003D2B1F36
MQVIEDRIEQERRKLGLGSNSAQASDENAFANLVGQYESLAVDLQFAEQSYTAALSAFDTAQAEAQRQSRYLAAYANPTLPESLDPARPAGTDRAAAHATRFDMGHAGAWRSMPLRDRR